MTADRTTITIERETMERLRRMKGFERTYDDLLREWADRYGED